MCYLLHADVVADVDVGVGVDVDVDVADNGAADAAADSDSDSDAVCLPFVGIEFQSHCPLSLLFARLLILSLGMVSRVVQVEAATAILSGSSTQKRKPCSQAMEVKMATLMLEQACSKVQW